MSMGAYESDHGKYFMAPGSSNNLVKSKETQQSSFINTLPYKNIINDGYSISSMSSNRYYLMQDDKRTVRSQIQNVNCVGFTTSFSHTIGNENELSACNMNLNVPVHESFESREKIMNELIDVANKVDAPPSTSNTCKNDFCPEPEGEIDIQIRNVVCNYTLPLHIDLHRIALATSNVTFDRARGVLLKQKRDPSCYVKIHSSGKVYIVGCRSEVECRIAARGIARMIQKQMGRIADSVRIRNYRICNVLATCKMPFGIRISELAQKYPQSCQYEPELSVGLIWRSIDPKATLRIHTTGSITVTGAVSENDVMRAFELIYPIVKEFSCAAPPRDILNNRSKNKRRRVLPSSSTYSDIKRPRLPINNELRSQCLSLPSSGAIGNRVYFSDEDDDELY